jgi:hypothetical protein
VLRVLCLLGMTLVLSYFTGPLLQALGRTKQLAILEWGRLAVGLAFLFVAARLVRNASVSWQVAGIALSRFVPMVLLITPVFVYILMYFCGISLRDIAASVAHSIFSALAITLAVFLFNATGLTSASRPVVQMIAQTCVGGIAGIVVLLSLDSQLRDLTRGVAGKLRLLSAPTR